MASFIVATKWAKGIRRPRLYSLSFSVYKSLIQRVRDGQYKAMYIAYTDSGRCWNRDGVLLVTAILNRKRDPREWHPYH